MAFLTTARLFGCVGPTVYRGKPEGRGGRPSCFCTLSSSCHSCIKTSPIPHLLAGPTLIVALLRKRKFFS